MIKRSELSAHRWHTAVLVIAAALVITGPVSAQDAGTGSKTAKPATNVAEGGYSPLYFDVFGGYQWFQFGQGTTNSIKQFQGAAVWGARLTEDFSKYVGLQESVQDGYNRLNLRPFGNPDFASASDNNLQIKLDAVVHLSPRGSKIRPFVFVGPAWDLYGAPNLGKLDPGSGTPAPVLLGTPSRSSNSVALSYGVGAKVNMSPKWGLRFDVEGMRSAQPHFNLPAIPTVPGLLYIPPKGHESSLTATVGVIFNLKYHNPPAPAPPPPPPPPPAPKADVQVSGITGGRDVCPGESVPLSVTASGWLPEQTPAYQWSVNGSPVSGATSSTFSLPTIDGSGAKSITVQVSAGDSSKTSSPVTVTVKPLTPPTIQFAIPQSTISYGTKTDLAATATGSECGGTATVRYSGEGVTGSTFDSSALNFDQTNRLKQQSRTVHITATATDAKNQTASAAADVTVTLTAQARRLDDLVYPANSSRVNNCAKRLLLEELTPMLRSDPDAKVLLIGHRDTSERAGGRPPVDEARVINAAAVLSAGKGICPSLDLSRIKVNWVGTEQSSEARPALCGTSTNVKERGGQAIRESDKRVQFRRVEVWIVPGGADMPAGVTGLKDAPAAEITPKGCPR